jgi:hypothetical protein
MLLILWDDPGVGPPLDHLRAKDSIDLTSTLIDDERFASAKGRLRYHTRGRSTDLVRSGQASIHQPMQLISLALQ